MWPLKTTARGAEFQWRWFQKSFSIRSGHFWPFGAFFGHFWPFFSQFWPQTQTCRKLVMWPLKMIAREAEIQWRWFRMSLFRYSDHVRSFWAFFGHFWPLLANFGPKVKIVINWSYDHSKWPQEKQKPNGDGLGCHFSDIQAYFGHFEPFLAIFDQFWPLTKNCRKLVIWPLKTITRRAEIRWTWFRMSFFRHSDHFLSFGAFFGHYWPFWQNFTQNSKLS